MLSSYFVFPFLSLLFNSFLTWHGIYSQTKNSVYKTEEKKKLYYNPVIHSSCQVGKGEIKKNKSHENTQKTSINPEQLTSIVCVSCVSHSSVPQSFPETTKNTWIGQFLYYHQRTHTRTHTVVYLSYRHKYSLQTTWG